MAIEIKLFTCPFCGGRPFITNDANAPKFVYIRCANCGARTGPCFSGIDNGKDYSMIGIREAAERWNENAPIRKEVLLDVSNQ